VFRADSSAEMNAIVEVNGIENLNGTVILNGNHRESKGDDTEDFDAAIIQALLAEKLFLASNAMFGSEKPAWFCIVSTQLQECRVLRG